MQNPKNAKYLEMQKKPRNAKNPKLQKTKIVKHLKFPKKTLKLQKKT